jgi:hypothetical protein
MPGPARRHPTNGALVPGLVLGKQACIGRRRFGSQTVHFSLSGRSKHSGNYADLGWIRAALLPLAMLRSCLLSMRLWVFRGCCGSMPPSRVSGGHVSRALSQLLQACYPERHLATKEQGRVEGPRQSLLCPCRFGEFSGYNLFPVTTYGTARSARKRPAARKSSEVRICQRIFGRKKASG